MLAAPRRDGTAASASAGAGPGGRRGAGAALGKGSAIYAVGGALNKAIGFLLLPIYTHHLTDQAYGAVGVVVVIATFTSMLFALAMGSAVNREFHAFAGRVEERREFVGSVLTFVIAVSLLASLALLLVGPWAFGPLLGEIGFWPLMAMGLAAAALQPFYDVLLIVLQAAERPWLYAVLSVGQVLLRTALAIAFVVGLDFQAEGVIGAQAIAAAAVFAAGGWLGRREARYCLRWRHVKTALLYALPLVPHTLVWPARLIVDRLFLLHTVGQGAAGLFHLAFQFGALIQVVCVACARALTPMLMRALHAGDHARLENLRNLGVTATVGFCWTATVVSLFAPEVIRALTPPEFHGAAIGVPFLAFTFVALGIYSILAVSLLFDPRLARRVSVCTVASLPVGIALNALLVPRLGVSGAALAALLTQVGVVMAVAALARAQNLLRWQHGRLATLFAVAFAVALWPAVDPWSGTWLGAGIKGLGALGLLAGLSAIAWGSPAFLVREVQRLRLGATAGAAGDVPPR
ncbi:MAG: lipopolysaccharide biosynthesis protein [Planctomycetota bacterium]